MRKILKILHTLGASGLIGGLACNMVMLSRAAGTTPAGYVDLRNTIVTISDVALVPALGLTLVSGVLSMSSHPPFHDRGWVWIKALTGIFMFESTLLMIGANGRRAADAADALAEGALVVDMAALSIGREWAALWIAMGICVLNVVLGVWRPRMASGVPAPSDTQEDAPAESLFGQNATSKNKPAETQAA